MMGTLRMKSGKLSECLTKKEMDSSHQEVTFGEILLCFALDATVKVDINL